jgi:hypothetical protein
MALPKISHPTFELTLPSNGKKIKLRPFLVKEEKVLLMASQSEDTDEILNSLKQVISNCIIESDVELDELATFDIEYIFLKLRSRSVNNIIKLRYKDNEDKKSYDLELNLDEVEVKTFEDHNNKIEINKEIGFTMKYPKVSITEKLKDAKNQTDVFFEMLKSSIDIIYEGKNEYNALDSSDEELEEFIQDLDVKTFNKIQKFYETIPRLYHELKYTNSLGNERVVRLETLNDFFTLG